MCRTIQLPETLANKIEYLNLVGDIGYTMEDFYVENGIAIQDMLNSETMELMEKAQKILEVRRGISQG
ncbi:MAG: hypothetical protein KAR39_07500 [Thermoplasmata archaeon]|nr:hypothetical protein [Thermoplasmata archaeon]